MKPLNQCSMSFSSNQNDKLNECYSHYELKLNRWTSNKIKRKVVLWSLKKCAGAFNRSSEKTMTKIWLVSTLPLNWTENITS